MELGNHLNPYSKLQNNIKDKLDNLDFNNSEKLELLNQIPSRWEKLGDMLLIPENSFNSDIWKEVLPILDKEIWKIF